MFCNYAIKIMIMIMIMIIIKIQGIGTACKPDQYIISELETRLTTKVYTYLLSLKIRNYQFQI